MPKTDSTFNPDEYALVADRIAAFYERYPAGRIVPRLHSATSHAVIFEALVYRDKSDTEPAAVGWAREFEGDGEINEVACLENTETSAIGRALANLGFAASKKRPSYEEMMKADRERRRLAVRNQPTSAAVPGLVKPARQSNLNLDLQKRANTATDVIRRLRIAQRLGLDARRAERLVSRVSDRDISHKNLVRIDRALVRWLSRRNETRFQPR